MRILKIIYSPLIAVILPLSGSTLRGAWGVFIPLLKPVLEGGWLIRILAVGCLFLFLLLPSFARSETDDPYVMMKGDSNEVAYEVKVTVSKEERNLPHLRQLPLKINTDQEGRSITVSMKPKLSIESSVSTDNRGCVKMKLQKFLSKHYFERAYKNDCILFFSPFIR